MAGLPKLKKIRASLRGLLTKTENYIAELQIELPSVEVDSRLQSLQDTVNYIRDTQNKIEAETEDTDLDDETEYRYNFEETATRIRTMLLRMKKATAAAASIPLQTSPNPTAPQPNIQPPKMNFIPLTEKETFQNFIKRLTVYFLLNNISDPKTKVYVLLSTIPPTLHERIYDLCSPEDPVNKPFGELTRILDEYIDPKPSIWALQHKFISRTQEQDENVATYASELKKLSLHCEFKCNNCEKTILENFLCLQFIRGLKDGDIRMKILQDREKLPFAKLVQIATSIEMGKTENSSMSADIQKRREPINKITPRSTLKETPGSSRPNIRCGPPKTIEDLKGKCFRCGKSDHRSNECGAKKSICLKCQKEGHLARVCLQPEKNTYQLDDSSSSESNDSTGDINLIKSEIAERYMIPIQIENKNLQMEFDTGAALSSMSLKHYKKLNIDKKIFKTNMKLKTYTGEVIEPAGVAYVSCTYKNQPFHGKLYIIKQEVDPIFGRSWMKEINIELADIRMVQTSEQLKLDQIFDEFATSVFQQDLGKIPNYKGHLSLNENVHPIFIKPRRIPYALKARVDEEIERLVAAGVITKVDHSDWGTPVVPIVKPNGSIRLCADYKVTLNKVIKDETYPIPIIEDIFAEMNGGKFFCTLDITQAYLNMEMDDESAALQTLSTHKGTYKVNRLMFGVKVAPSLWQKFMDQLLQGLDGVKCFFDDIIIQGATENQLLKRLKDVLLRLKQSNLRVNKEKCHFFKRSINYLGHTIDKDGLHKNKEKTKAIADTDRPTNINELRTFLGMANYYNKFIPNLASLTNPLNELLKKRTEFIWSAKCEDSFIKIKREILSEKVLMHFDPRKPLVLATDASPTGLGAVLSHKLPDGTERPIAFASRTLSNSEKKYSQIDKEATAIYWGVKKFFHYCYGRKFILVTDHKPLTSIFHPQQTLPALSTMRLFHYAHFLSGFDYDIEYRMAAKHSNADYLSRFPVEKAKENSKDQHCTFQTQLILKLDVSPRLIAQETKDDPELNTLLTALKMGRSIKQFGYKDNELTLQDDCILKGTRVMIPHRLQAQILDELHAGHIGIVKMKLLARSYVYWKNIDTDIEHRVKSCRACRLEQNEPAKVPLHHWEEATAPWQRIHVDFAGPVAGHQLFVVVDAYTKWVEIIPTKTTTSSWVILKLKELFVTFGTPFTLVSDNGRQFTSQEFRTFLSDHGTIHRTSAPYHPATNGLAERNVQTIKRALRSMEGEGGDLVSKLLVVKARMRRTPTAEGRTPYDLMFGRDVRTRLEAMLRTRHTAPPSSSDQDQPVRELATGARVQARNYATSRRWEFGTVTQRLGRLHYEVLTDGGLRWRRHIEQLLPAPRVPQPAVED